MAQSTFSLQWEAHRNNICNGLSVLQQNEEFVDMTLAADGHFVKVHQMVMALASPYFKELISTAEGRHPVIFLNKISYTTLSAILEYIYTGEVLVSIENLSELVQTAKELHVRGLEDMKLQDPTTCAILRSQAPDPQPDPGTEPEDGKDTDDEICYFEITGDDAVSQKSNTYSSLVLDDEALEGSKSITVSEMDEDNVYQEDSTKSQRDYFHTTETTPSVMQYTISNQGSLQMILNRYMYYLKHSNRNNTRQWRCVDYLNKVKCPALVVTKDNVVKQRLAAHTHPRHDHRILKKVHSGCVYTALQEAEEMGEHIKSKDKQTLIEIANTQGKTQNVTGNAIPLSH